MNLLKIWKLSLMPGAMLFSQGIYGQVSSSAVVPANSVGPDQMRPFAWMASSTQPFVHGPGQSSSVCVVNGCFYYPSDIRTAYASAGIPNANGGAGITVGIVDAYYDSQTEANLLAFTTQFGLPACTTANGCLTIVSQTGGSPTGVAMNSGWAQETNLDVQWVHAIAPNAKILLVAANNNQNANLYAAEQYAFNHANVVSNSWGGDEASGQTVEDTALAGSTVPILFSSGDLGAEIEYPCSSSHVTCVGGTTLLETATSFRGLESVWGTAAGAEGTGGGCSRIEAQPNYQSGYTDSACTTHRGVPDIAALADPNTGALVYLGSNACAGVGAQACTANTLYEFGGTSLACPLTAGYIALVDASRAAVSKAPLGLNLNQLLYAAAANPYYHYRYWDVTAGNSGVPATAGWDRATGLGVPLGPALAAYLISQP